MKLVIKKILKFFGKRITNYNSPAKPFDDGVSFLKTIIDEPKWIIDIGVADGTPDITNVFPYSDYKYLLVEANPKFFSCLEEAVKKYPENVTLEKVFCGEDEGVTHFCADETGRGSSRYLTEGVKDQFEVKSTKLDSLFDKHNLSGPVFLKIDVEGAEIDVLKGATKTLSFCDVVILESWINPKNTKVPSNFAEIVKNMEENSFCVFDFFGGHSYETGVLKMVDVVFVKKDSPYRLKQNNI